MFKKVYSLYSAFCTQPAFYSQSAVCILHSVCSLLLVRSLRFTLTGFKNGRVPAVSKAYLLEFYRVRPLRDWNMAQFVSQCH